jgi:hypothetical protein
MDKRESACGGNTTALALGTAPSSHVATTARVPTKCHRTPPLNPDEPVVECKLSCAVFL